MSIVFLNNAWVQQGDAKISILDRGFLFADSIYEVTAFINGNPVDYADHFERLLRSCEEMDFECPLSLADFESLHRSLMMKNNISEGVVYFQMTRGVADRNFIYANDMTPTILAFGKAVEIMDHPLAKSGIRIKTAEDLRWARCDIKTTQLTAQSMTKTRVQSNGYDDAWMVRDGFVTEGTSSNAFIVNDEGVIITQPLSNIILGGVTRGAIIKHALSLGFIIEERSFTVEELMSASEAFSTSTSTIALPIIEVDDQTIGDGLPGPVFQKLRQAYVGRVRDK